MSQSACCSLSTRVEMLFRCSVLWCLLSPVFSYNTDSEILYKEAESSSFSHQVRARQIDLDGARGLFFQKQNEQVQQCRAPGRQRGRCVSLESCVLQDIYQDYVKNKNFFCVLRNKGGIGVCCPNDITTPTRYKKGIFKQRSGSVKPTSMPAEKSTPKQPTTTEAATILDRVSASADEPAINDAYPAGEWIVCGLNSKTMAGITSGSETTVKDWPWMVVLLYRLTRRQFCGGTLITKQHVLTAAHCFSKINATEILLSLGDYSLKRQDDSKSRLFSVQEIIIHEDYDVYDRENDIAIILMNETTIYNSYIQPCCLPAPGPKYPNLTTVLTGWGKTLFGGPSSDVLMEVKIPIWEQEKCKNLFPLSLFDENMCAAAFEGGKDACQEDSGGPLVTQRKDKRWTIVGVVSWGIRCGEKNKPGIYTRVNEYLDWISQIIL